MSMLENAAAALRPYCGPHERVIWRAPFRWHDANGVLPNHFESLNVPDLAETFGYEIVLDLNCVAIVRDLRATKRAEEARRELGRRMYRVGA